MTTFHSVGHDSLSILADIAQVVQEKKVHFKQNMSSKQRAPVSESAMMLYVLLLALDS